MDGRIHKVFWGANNHGRTPKCTKVCEDLYRDNIYIGGREAGRVTGVREKVVDR